MGDGKVKLGRGSYAISTAILSMYAGFQQPGTKYRVFFLLVPPKMFKYFFFNWTPQHYWGGPIQKNYFNILGGTSKKNTL